MKKVIVCILLVLALAGCASERKSYYAGPGGSMGACRQMCNRDNDVCSDAQGARDDLTVDRPAGLTTACDRQLQNCMDMCGRNLGPKTK